VNEIIGVLAGSQYTNHSHVDEIAKAEIHELPISQRISWSKNPTKKASVGATLGAPNGPGGSKEEADQEIKK